MSFLQIPIGTYPNTFLGYEALQNVVVNPPTTGINNTAFGFNALKSTTSGFNNTAFGNLALSSLVTGNNNTALGDQAMGNSVSGSINVAIGAGALKSVSGQYNTGIGVDVGGFSIVSGDLNTFIGYGSGSDMTTGSRNVILGGFRGFGGGAPDIRTLSNYIVLSDGAGNPRLWIDNTGAVNIPGGIALTGSLSITGGTVTANNPVLSATQTWNNAAVTFTGWQLNVTDTASNAASLLMDLQVGGVSQFAVRKSSIVTATTFRVPENSGTIEMGGSGGSGTRFQTNSGAQIRVYHNGVSTISLSLSSFVADNNSSFSFTSGDIGTTSDLFIRRDAANTLAQRNGVNAQTLRVYNTFTDASNYERGRLAWVSNVLTIGTENAGTGLARALDIQTGGTSRILVDTSGRVSVGTSSAFDRLTVQNFSGVSGGIFVLGSPADGNWGGGITLANYLGTIYGSINAATSGVNIGSSALSSGVFIRTAGSGDTSALFDNNKNVVLNSAAIATNATNGFLYVAGCAGTPTGTPTAYTGRVPIVVDTTNNKLYFYSGGAWRDAGP